MTEFSENDFWALIDLAPKGIRDPFVQSEILVDLLATRPIEDIYAFDFIFAKLMLKCYTVDISSAAHLINGGGGGDDGFVYFRCWLILKGKYHFYKTLENADHLAEALEDECGAASEPLLYVASGAFEQKTGKSADDYYAATDLADYQTDPPFDLEDTRAFLMSFYGEDEEILKQRLPKLYQKIMQGYH